MCGYLGPPRSSSTLSPDVTVYFRHASDPWLSNCLRIRKVIRLVFVSKHDLGSCQQARHQEDFACSSHNKSSQQVMFSVKPDGEKKRTAGWIRATKPPTDRFWYCSGAAFDLKLRTYLQARLTFPAESVQAVYDDATNRAAGADSPSGGRARSGGRPRSGVCLLLTDVFHRSACRR